MLVRYAVNSTVRLFPITRRDVEWQAAAVVKGQPTPRKMQRRQIAARLKAGLPVPRHRAGGPPSRQRFVPPRVRQTFYASATP